MALGLGFGLEGRARARARARAGVLVTRMCMAAGGIPMLMVRG